MSAESLTPLELANRKLDNCSPAILPSELKSNFDLVKRNLAELVTEEELAKVMEKPCRRAYIGFEPSGFVHLGWKLCANKIIDLVNAGFEMQILLADWHAMINDKLGGDLSKIQACGKYMEDCFYALGVPREKIKFVYANDFVSDPKYWETVINVAKNTSLARMKRAMDIMGRSADELEKDVSKFIYPAMQVADIFYMNIDLAYGGMDQRHAHMLCRDIAPKLVRIPPVAIHTPLLSGLKGAGRMDPVKMENGVAVFGGNQAKMSKSDPDSAVFIHDSAEDIRRKIQKAFCPEKIVEGNPITDICRFIVFAERQVLEIKRPEKYGGNLTINGYDELAHAFSEGQLHPMDLKAAVAEALVEILEPVRKYFEMHPENLEKMRKMIVTR